MHWDGDWHLGWMWIWWVLIIVAVVAVLWLAMTATRRGGGGGDDNSPEQVLKRRYAQGDIDRNTYERMLEDLRK